MFRLRAEYATYEVSWIYPTREAAMTHQPPRPGLQRLTLTDLSDRSITILFEETKNA